MSKTRTISINHFDHSDQTVVTTDDNYYLRVYMVCKGEIVDARTISPSTVGALRIQDDEPASGEERAVVLRAHERALRASIKRAKTMLAAVLPSFSQEQLRLHRVATANRIAKLEQLLSDLKEAVDA
jgi:hypothetical protein